MEKLFADKPQRGIRMTLVIKEAPIPCFQPFGTPILFMTLKTPCNQ
jgi:hypothetical protein